MSAVREFQAEGHRQAVHWPFEQVSAEARRATERTESSGVLMDYRSGDQVEIALGNNPDHTKNRWEPGIILGPSRNVSTEWDVDVNGKVYQTHWANLRPAPEAKAIVFTEAERTKLMWLVGKVHAQRMAKLELVPDPDDPPTDPELVQLHGILSKIRRAKK
jgi:hypothetical protein